MVGKNNPFNIRWNPRNQWKGLSQNPVNKGFCNFKDIKFGIRAAAYLLIVSYRKKGIKTYGEIIKRFAPPFENDTDKYIQFVCDSMKVFPFDGPTTRIRYAHLLHYMSIYEGNRVEVFDIFEVINLFNLKLK